jgi:glycerol-3-phosphate dehydrogenase (NAD(P)+)
MNVAILGAGAWGTALAVALASHHRVALWTRRADHRERLERTRENPYLPGVALPEAIALADDARRALEGCELAIVVTPTAALRETLARLPAEPGATALLWACKGFEPATSHLPHEIVAEARPAWRAAGALSGPSFAIEVARGLPAALTVAARDAAFAQRIAGALQHPPLRIYSSGDVVGVELGGALKNIMAIAAGICDGLGLGANARAALVTRGLAEMARLGTALGGEPDTFMGLTGLGDLVLTATGDLSRNRSVGLRVAQGVPVDRILAELGHVAEGVPSSRAALALARRHGVDMPITRAVCAVLFEGLAPRAAVQGLLTREARPE